MLRSRITPVVIAAVIIGLMATGVSFAGVGDYLRLGKENSSASSQTFIQGVTSGSGYKHYVLRVSQANSSGGGGMIYSSHSSQPAQRATNRNTTTGGKALEAESQKGTPASFVAADGTSAPFTVNTRTKVDNLKADDSDKLNGAASSRYGAAGARIESDGTVSGVVAAYGFDTTQAGGDGVERLSEGDYRVFLPSTANAYIVQVTPISSGAQRNCHVADASATSGALEIICSNNAASLVDSAFFVSATKP